MVESRIIYILWAFGKGNSSDVSKTALRPKGVNANIPISAS